MAGNTERDAVRAGFTLWEDPISNLRFLEVCNAANADIVIRWETFAHGDPNPNGDFPPPGDFDGVNGTLAHTLGGPPPNAFGALAGDIHFDDSETWVNAIRGNDNQPIDLVTVAAHEIGHAIGLDHTTVGGSLMLINYTQSHRFLGSDDIAGIRSLYGNPPNSFINGADIVCTTSNYSVVDVPSVATVTWTSSNTSILTIGSTSGTATAVGNGLVTITATVSTGCGSVALTRNIWVGLPNPPSVISFEADPCGSYVGAGTENVVSPVKYTWNLDFTDYETTSTNLYLENGAPPVSSFQLNAGQHFLKVKVENACGTSNFGPSKIFNTSNCGGSMMLSVSPNPAKDNINISLAEKADETTKVDMLEIVIVDRTGNVIYQNKYKAGVKNISVNVTTFKPDVYTVIVFDGKQKTSAKFVKN